MSFTNSMLTAQAALSFFSGNVTDNNFVAAPAYRPVDTLNRIMRVVNCKILGGGRYSRKPTGWVEMNPGSNIITVRNNQEFSFHDLTEYEQFDQNYRQCVLAISRYEYTGAKLDTSSIYWARVRGIINDSTAIIDTSYREVDFDIEGRPGGSASFSTSSNILTGTGATCDYTNPYGGFLPGNRLYTQRIVPPSIFPEPKYIGTVQIVNSATSITLTSNAAWDTSGVIIFTNVQSTGFPHALYGKNYYFRPVPWATTNTAKLYTARLLYRYAAFHATYISGNVGVDFRNNFYDILRYGRNAQNNACPNNGIGLNICGSCLNYREVPTRYNTCDDNIFSYPVQGELKVMVAGLGYGLSYGQFCELLPASIQKR